MLLRGEGFYTLLAWERHWEEACTVLAHHIPNETVSDCVTKSDDVSEILLVEQGFLNETAEYIYKKDAFRTTVGAAR